MEPKFKKYILSILFVCFSTIYSFAQAGGLGYKLHNGAEKQWTEVGMKQTLGNKCDFGQILVFSNKNLLQRKKCVNSQFQPAETCSWQIVTQRNGRNILIINKSERYLVRFTFKDLTPDDGVNNKVECLWLTIENPPSKNNPRTHIYFRSG